MNTNIEINALYNSHNIDTVLKDIDVWDKPDDSEQEYSYLMGYISPKQYCLNGFSLYKDNEKIMTSFLMDILRSHKTNHDDVIKQFLEMWLTHKYPISFNKRTIIYTSIVNLIVSNKAFWKDFSLKWLVDMFFFDTIDLLWNYVNYRNETRTRLLLESIVRFVPEIIEHMLDKKVITLEFVLSPKFEQKCAVVTTVSKDYITFVQMVLNKFAQRPLSSATVKKCIKHAKMRLEDLEITLEDYTEDEVVDFAKLIISLKSSGSIRSESIMHIFMKMNQFNKKLYRLCIDTLCKDGSQLIKHFKTIEKRVPIKFTYQNFKDVFRENKKLPAIKYILSRKDTTFSINTEITRLKKEMDYRPAKYKDAMYSVLMEYNVSREQRLKSQQPPNKKIKV